MINKKVNNVQEALQGVKSGMTFMLEVLACVEFLKMQLQNW